MIDSTSETNNEDQQGGDVRVGWALRKARESRGLSLEETAEQLHLSCMLLNDIEAGRTERMAGIYRRGYVLNYARLVGLDGQALLEQLDPQQPPPLRDVLPASRRDWRFERWLKFATYVIVTTLIVPPLVVIYVQSGWRMTEPESLVVQADEMAADDRVSASEERVARRIARALSLDDAADYVTAADGPVAANVLPIAAIRPVRDTEAAQHSVLTEPVEAPAEVQPELAIRLLDDSWVEISDAQGQRLEFDLLRAGQERRYRGAAPFRILLGRASSVELRLNGELIDYPGANRADVARLELLESGEVLR